ncbi:MAG: SAM-dependent chlorinase/fluorinase [Candidatus Lokiarchaeota archaeon]|nr:SAM-dependent chlorinase/fluorinase [Candidatus Lokiarchaeota archaeon]
MAKLHKRIIGLITDFGPKGQHYVASMKGVILNINSEVNIVDISHSIAPFSIIEASYIFNTTYRYYPEGTVFIIVVDPGVGSSREILALKTVNNYYLVAPNNGIFLSSFELNDFSECIEITNEEFFNKPISKTFHGRDIMAPIAANITKGLPLSKFGAVFNPSRLISYPIELNKISDNEIRCTIQYIDNFGNIITNIKASSLSLKDGAHLRVKLKKAEFNGKFFRFFEKVIKGSILFLVGSSGFLEISINQGNAAEDLGVSVGDIVTVLLSEVKNK